MERLKNVEEYIKFNVYKKEIRENNNQYRIKYIRRLCIVQN